MTLATIETPDSGKRSPMGARRIAAAQAAQTQAPRNVQESFILGVRDIMTRHALTLATITQDEADRIMAARMFYGTGLGGSYRGITAYGTWKASGRKVDIVEIAAAAQESYVQLACTTIHEFGHVIAGHGAGHAKEWQDRTESLGFAKRPEAAGMRYDRATLAPGLMAAVDTLALGLGADRPDFARTLGIGLRIGRALPRPCSAGIGTRGGTSRGTGSGSRQILWACACERPVKVRAARSSGLDVTCNTCGTILAPIE